METLVFYAYRLLALVLVLVYFIKHSVSCYMYLQKILRQLLAYMYCNAQYNHEDTHIKNSFSVTN